MIKILLYLYITVYLKVHKEDIETNNKDGGLHMALENNHSIDNNLSDAAFSDDEDELPTGLLFNPL